MSGNAGADFCYGDEQITFAPASPRVGNEVLVAVTSARPHPYGRLAGTERAAFVRERTGQLGYVWEWTLTPTWEGQHEYTFYVDSTIPCKREVLQVGGPLGTPTPTPTRDPLRSTSSNGNGNGNGNSNLNVNSNDNTSSGSSADVSLTQTVSQNPVSRGHTLVYTFFVANGGPNGADNVTLTDPLPTGMTYKSSTSSRGSCSHSGGIVTCSIGRLSSGANATIRIEVTADVELSGGTSATITNTATVTSDETDLSSATNVASQSVTVNP